MSTLPVTTRMADGRPLTVAGDLSASTCFVQPVDEHDLSLLVQQAEAAAALSASADWCLAAWPIADWWRELTPWAAPPTFGKRPYGDGAAETLHTLLNEVLPALNQPGRRFHLVGYSLAGLFALWAGTQTDAFTGIGGVSPSVWYPDWLNWAENHPTKAAAVYLSLGDREEKARNPVMAAVGEAIRSQHRLLNEQGIPCTLDWNPGNHFVDSDRRLAKAMAWLMRAVNG